MVAVTEHDQQAELGRALRLLDGAIALVRRGVATRVTVVNLPLAADVLDAARARAGVQGLRVTAVGSGDGAPCTLVVEAANDRGGPLSPAPR
jgi:hypothetical protein